MNAAGSDEKDNEMYGHIFITSTCQKAVKDSKEIRW